LRRRLAIAALGVSLASGLIAGYGSTGNGVDQLFGHKIGMAVTGCHELFANGQRTVYQCDRGVSGVIEANGTLHVAVVSGLGHP